MKSRKISSAKILVAFANQVEHDRFMQSYTGTIFSREKELETIVENSTEAINFIRGYCSGDSAEQIVTEENSVTSSNSTEPQPERMSSAREESETKSIMETESQVSVQQPVDLSSVVREPPASVVSVRRETPGRNSMVSDRNSTVSDRNSMVSDRNSMVSDRNSMVSYHTERFRPVAASPTEEYELDAELFRIRRSLAKIEKAQREFMVYARRDLNDKQLHRLERITLYIQRLRHSIQPDL